MAKRVNLNQAQIRLLGTDTDKNLAKKWKCSSATVMLQRKKHSIPRFSKNGKVHKIVIKRNVKGNKPSIIANLIAGKIATPAHQQTLAERLTGVYEKDSNVMFFDAGRHLSDAEAKTAKLI